MCILYFVLFYKKDRILECLCRLLKYPLSAEIDDSYSPKSRENKKLLCFPSLIKTGETASESILITIPLLPKYKA